jgi:NAD(P)-dependent dehydrogenase (short-subunit alcohol dehydrogenase family)
LRIGIGAAALATTAHVDKGQDSVVACVHKLLHFEQESIELAAELLKVRAERVAAPIDVRLRKLRILVEFDTGVKDPHGKIEGLVVEHVGESIAPARPSAPPRGTGRRGALYVLGRGADRRARPCGLRRTKAALHSLARSLRAELADTRIRVFEVLPPVVDTDLERDLDVPKIPPSAVVDAIVAGVEREREEIPVGRVKQLVPLARILTAPADRIVLRALGGFEAAR